MKIRTVLPSVVILMIGIAYCQSAVADWPWWRGPNSSGVAADGQSPPTRWSADENVVWKTAVPGRGHSSPIVIGESVLLTTADEARQTQSVICYARNGGKELWQTVINKGGFAEKIHNKNTHASPTLAYDTERIFAAFNNHDGVQLAALDEAGKILWKRRASAFIPNQYKFGYAPSPLLHQQLVIIASDFDGEGSSLAAFDRETGREVWRTPRPKQTSYSSPIIARVAGRDQLLISGCGQVVSYDPANGKPLWRCDGPAKATCGTMVWDGDLVFASGGYPEKETLAIRADGSAEVVWRNQERCYEQSMLAHDGYLYALNDTGIALCFHAKTGELQWKERLGGPVSASPTLSGGNIYASNEKGTTFVFRADPQQFTLIAKNQLGDESFASPVIVDSQIFLRIADSRGGKREETLYCIGAE
jgi:hypothetical protein